MAVPAGLLVAVVALGVVLLIVCVAGQGRLPHSESFMRGTQYRPACGAHWLQNRVRECKGMTTGEMPSIEEDPYLSWLPCCGSLGVPPPTYH